ncbi:MAG: NAD(P)/FAD-dependent oxidoreductase [Oscillospiraceae bacterium]|nr:NAD(P)/FAD-dependent oxidoreductase [Oscillospiraceae bacterium]
MNRNETFYDLAVIGAGPAGMMCAYTAAERGLKVAVIDPNRYPGRKLRITGKGRCNLTNDCDIRKFLENVPRNGKFLYSCINAFPPSAVISFFEEKGLHLKTERGARVFPLSDNANDVADTIARLCREKGVVFIRDRVRKLLIGDGAVCGVETAESTIYSPNAALCTGGLSYPLTGSSGDGHRFAASAGHTITPCRPSLVPLESSDDWCGEMQGFSLRNISLTVYENNKAVYSDFGEMLFTHFGVSGPVILSASAHMRNFGTACYRLEIDLKPALDEKKLDSRMLRDFQKYSNREIKNALSDLAASSMIPVLIKLSGIPEDTKVNSITREQREKLRDLFKRFPVSVSGTRPIDEAIVTSGGVDVKEIDPRSMRSKLVKGLYFAGEIIDVDAYTGGFNLQIAWATGHMAGLSAGTDK